MGGNGNSKLSKGWTDDVNKGNNGFFQIDLDKKFGCTWHVVAGEEFGFDLDFKVGR